MRKQILVVALATAIVALGAAACSSDDEAGTSNAGLVAAINIIDNAGLHDIDEAINEESEVPAAAGTTALKLQATIALVEWPEDLAESAESLGETFGELAQAIEGEEPDLAIAGTAATAAHDEAHDFSQAVWAYLYGEAGVGAGEQDDHS